jgi:hypothetical protein
MCTNGARRWNHDRNLNWNFDDLGIVPHVTNHYHEYDKSHP